MSPILYVFQCQENLQTIFPGVSTLTLLVYWEKKYMIYTFCYLIKILFHNNKSNVFTELLKYSLRLNNFFLFIFD